MNVEHPSCKNPPGRSSGLRTAFGSRVMRCNDIPLREVRSEQIRCLWEGLLD